LQKRIRLLSVKGGVGKSVLALQIANYLKEIELPFVIEELDPLETICVLTSCSEDYWIIKYYSTNDFLYNRLKIDEKKLERQYLGRWLIAISDTYTNISPDNEAIIFQNKITDKNLNVFLTDKITVNETINYARKWEGPRVLIVNFSNESIVSDLLDYVYNEGLFVKIFSIPIFDSLSDFQNSEIVKNIIKELLDILVRFT